MASRKISVEILGDASGLAKAFGKSADAGRSFGAAIGKVAKVSALAAGAAGIGGLAIVLKQGIAEFSQSSKVAAQTEAAIKSTGGAANVTARQVDALSQSMLRKTGIDDDAIKTGANMLLTFTNVRNEVGKGNDIFNQANKALADMATRMNGGAIPSAEQLNSTAIRLGKALNDPIKGMSALSRVGVLFTESQKDQIKAMVKAGDTMGAQKLILQELNTEFGGSAEAAGRTLPGKLAILKESFNNLSGEIVSGLAPAFATAVGMASDFVAKLSAAKGLRAKLNIVWTGIQEAGQTITGKLGDAMRTVDWSAVWNQASGIADGLRARFEQIDWSAVGAAIGDGIADAVARATGPTKKIADNIAQIGRSIDFVKFGKAMGPGLAAALVTAFVALLDPVFWAKNWDLALAVALAVFGKGVGKIIAPLGGLLGGAVGRAFSDGIVAVAAVIERLSPRLASAVMSGLLRLPGLIGDLLGKIGGIVSSGFARLGALARFSVKILGIQAAVNALADFAAAVFEKAKEIGRAIIDGILAGVSGLGSMLADKLKSAIGGAIAGVKSFFGISSPSRVTAEQIGQPLSEGVIQGWVLGSASLPEKMKDSVRKAIEAARANVEAARGSLSGAWSGLTGDALSAFDAITGQIQTRSEKLLGSLQLKRRLDEMRSAIAEARSGLAAARANVASVTAGGPNEGESDADFQARRAQALAAVTSAQKQLDDALFAQREFGLQQRAEQERRARDRETANRRKNFEAALGELGASLAKEGATATAATNAVLKLLGKFGVNFREVGASMGQAWVAGLKESLEQAAKKAGALAGTVGKAAAGITVPKMAHGGIVTRPTLAMIGEAGPEAVIPLGRRGGSGGSGQVVSGDLVINVGGRELGRIAWEELLRVKGRNVSVGLT